MSGIANEALDAVRTYHRLSKHHFDAYAPGPGFLDWDSQPDPFRRFEGAAAIPLPLNEGAGKLAYDDLYLAPSVVAEPLTADSLGLFCELALGLSAWKVAGPDRWALRNNPSSGNLHPTEGYLLLLQKAGDELLPGLYHYAPHAHALERRALLPATVAARIAADAPACIGAFCLTSIVWREAWKYGARAFRYCQHDVGHALAAAAFSARVNGWRLRLDARPGDMELAALLGLDRTSDFAAAEPEHPDLIAVLCADDVHPDIDWSAVADALTDWQGRANQLSAERVEWTQITAVLPHVEKTALPVALPAPANETAMAAIPAHLSPDATTLIRQRRSAQRMDGEAGIAFEAFCRLLGRTLPSTGHAAFAALALPPAINLLLFVHEVEGLAPGLYLLDRVPGRLDAFRTATASAPFDWQPLPKTRLPLYHLATGDMRKLASQLSCHQGIAGHGAFSLGMIAEFGRVLEELGPWAYRRLYWEAGVIGQVLYLEAEAAGLRGTGIGCYFDDGVHDLLGLARGSLAWQSLYHFTIGGPIEDRRLLTEPAYAHLPQARRRHAP